MFFRRFCPTLLPATVIASTSTATTVAFADFEGSKVNGDHIIHTPSFGHVNVRSQPKKSTHLLPAITLESLTLISGTAHRSLAESISKEIGVPLCKAAVSRFADGEVSVTINDNIRGQDVFIVQTCAAPVNDSIMELLLTVSCARRANVRKITAVIPYFGYKHHRRGNAISTKHHSRFLWSGAGDFAAMLQEMGVDRVITVDLQRPGQGLEASFFDNTVPLETIVTTDIFINKLLTELHPTEPITVVAPNAECFSKAKKFQSLLQKSLGSEVKLLAFFSPNGGSGPIDVSQLRLLGDKPIELPGVGGDVVIVDDMVDSAGTIAELSTRLCEAGAKNILVCASHGLFTENAVDLIENSKIDKVFVTDTLPIPATKNSKIEQLSVVKYLANVILTEHFRSMIFEEEEYEED